MDDLTGLYFEPTDPTKKDDIINIDPIEFNDDIIRVDPIELDQCMDTYVSNSLGDDLPTSMIEYKDLMMSNWYDSLEGGRDGTTKEDRQAQRRLYKKQWKDAEKEQWKDMVGDIKDYIKVFEKSTGEAEQNTLGEFVIDNECVQSDGELRPQTFHPIVLDIPVIAAAAAVNTANIDYVTVDATQFQEQFGHKYINDFFA